MLILPFLILVAVLLVALQFTGNEGLAAFAALGSLVPYYLLLWLFRDKVQQGISFRIDD